MKLVKIISCFITMMTCMKIACCQTVQSPVPDSVRRLLFNTAQFIKTDSGLIINNYYKDACKSYSVKKGFIPAYIIVPLEKVAVAIKELPKPKFITIHGNISYDFFYRSKIDTPFSQQNLQQHTERIWLDILIKEKYPFKVGFTARQSNSPFYKDLYSVNLNFDRNGYTKNIKKDLLEKLVIAKWQHPELKLIDTILKNQIRQHENLKAWINGPEALQRMIETKEKLFFVKHKIDTDSIAESTASIPVYHTIKLNNGQLFKLKTDSLVKLKPENELPVADSAFIKLYNEKKEEMLKMEKSIAMLKRQSDSVRNGIEKNIVAVKQAIYKATDPKQLQEIAKQNGIKETEKEKIQNFLSDVKSIGIGRNMIDYTELTAQNIMLTGVNIEYNPSYYVAFAAGKVDYGLRDFLGRGVKQKNQYLLLGRIGWGDQNKRSVILTLFNGRKNTYAGLLAADSGNNSNPLFGYSVEVNFKKNENTFITAEVAKSTKNRITTTLANADKPDNLFNYGDDSNVGYNVKAQTIIPATDTRLSGFYRKTGEQFQSFSLFTYNTDQQSWQVKAEQSFLHRKISITGMLQQNDFTNPLTNKTFKTSTVFKSFLLNVKVPHWPILNAGYYPATQFYIVDNNTVKENAYYILNGSVIYPYKFKDIAATSSLIYNRYFNQATDSGFILYKGVNYILSQSLLFKKLQIEGCYSYNKQSTLNYYTLDANGDYSLEKIFRVGGGIKYNHVFQGNDYWGKAMRVSAALKKLGRIQLQYEKSYLPTIQQALYPVEIGRVSWYKFF